MEDTLEAVQLFEGLDILCNIVLPDDLYAMVDLGTNGRPLVGLATGPLPEPLWRISLTAWDGKVAKAYIGASSGNAFWNTGSAQFGPGAIAIMPDNHSTILLTLQPQKQNSFLLQAAYEPGGNIGPAQGPNFAYLSTGAAAPVLVTLKSSN